MSPEMSVLLCGRLLMSAAAVAAAVFSCCRLLMLLLLLAAVLYCCRGVLSMYSLAASTSHGCAPKRFSRSRSKPELVGLLNCSIALKKAFKDPTSGMEVRVDTNS